MKFPEECRVPDSGPWSSRLGDEFGVFAIPFSGRRLRTFASSGSPEIPWEHVSVSLPDRCPTWTEMCYIKGMFWDDDETVMQLHVPSGDHVNCHPYCLHLWRPLTAQIPRPPAHAVGPGAGS